MQYKTARLVYPWWRGVHYLVCEGPQPGYIGDYQVDTEEFLDELLDAEGQHQDGQQDDLVWAKVLVGEWRGVLGQPLQVRVPHLREHPSGHEGEASSGLVCLQPQAQHMSCISQTSPYSVMKLVLTFTMLNTESEAVLTTQPFMVTSPGTVL